MLGGLKAHNSPQGGDVLGTRKYDISQGEPLAVAEASFSPGYDLTSTLKAGYINEADLTQGFCSYGIAAGEGMPQGGKKIG